MAAAIHACTTDGDGLFQGLWVDSSVPGFMLDTDPIVGVCVGGEFSLEDDDRKMAFVATCGSPSPE